jgi:hypothetical protein
MSEAKEQLTLSQWFNEPLTLPQWLRLTGYILTLEYANLPSRCEMFEVEGANYDPIDDVENDQFASEVRIWIEAACRDGKYIAQIRDHPDEEHTWECSSPTLQGLQSQLRTFIGARPITTPTSIAGSNVPVGSNVPAVDDERTVTTLSVFGSPASGASR